MTDKGHLFIPLWPFPRRSGAFTRTAVVAAGAATVASPLLLADLEGVSQPQLYSVCGGDAPPLAEAAAKPHAADGALSAQGRKTPGCPRRPPARGATCLRRRVRERQCYGFRRQGFPTRLQAIVQLHVGRPGGGRKTPVRRNTLSTL